MHAAALKQVPACEYNPMEAIKTNIMGSSNVVDAALDAGVKKVLALSTDKAVNPVNLYGATKLAAEKLIVQSNAYAGGRSTRAELRALRQRGRQPRQRGAGFPQAAPERQGDHHRRPHDPLLADPRAGRAFRHRCIEQMHGGEVFVPKIPSMTVDGPGPRGGSRQTRSRSSASAPARSCTRCLSPKTKRAIPSNATACSS